MSMLKFRIDRAVIHDVFNHGFGGIENFADVWNGTLEDDEPVVRTQRSAKTIYAWIQHGLPSSRDTMMQFFGALGVDPVATVDVDSGTLQRQFARLRRAFLLGGLNVGGFRSLFELYSPGADWPDDAIAAKYFSRKWSKFDFSHEATDVKNTYVTITVVADDGIQADWPRAYHIAYRRRSNADGLWRPYGTVITRSREAILIHENGDLQREKLAYGERHCFSFKTHFGPSPADFRLACLGEFTASLEPRDVPDVSLHFVG